MSHRLSVVVPTHNPRPDYLVAVLEALRAQTLPYREWELIVVDNCSTPALDRRLDLSWHPGARVVREDRLGLTRARVAGFKSSTGDPIVLVDDDNVLASDYLEQALSVMAKSPFVGAWGGGIRPQYEEAALAPPAALHALLTLRTVDSDLWSNDPGHHASTPWGAGLCVRRAVAVQYMDELEAHPERYGLDLQGARLVYGGDTDIAFTACRMGLAKAVFSALEVTHLIARDRCTEAHLCRVAFGRGYTEIIHHHTIHGDWPVRRGRVLRGLRTLYKRWNMTPLERAVHRAGERGRQAAIKEFISDS